MRTKNKIALLLALGTVTTLSADSFIYYMTSRRNFSFSLEWPSEKKTYCTFSTFPLGYMAKNIKTREKHDDIGAIFDIIFNLPKGWWLEATTAYFNEQAAAVEKGRLSAASRTALDDLLLMVGYNPLEGKPTQVLLFGMAGFPTTWKINPRLGSLQLVGSRVFSTGFATEVSFPIVENHHYGLFGVLIARFIHFFSRHFAPVIPQGTYHPGNRTDLFWAFHARMGQHHLELAYYPSFYTNISEHVPSGKKSFHSLIYNSVYVSYILKPDCVPVVFGCGVWGTVDAHAHDRGFAWWLYGEASF